LHRRSIVLGLAAALLAGVVQAQAPAASGANSGLPFAAEIASFVETDKASPPKTCETLLVGSSSIRFWTTAQADLAPLIVINRGFGGSQIDDVNLYFDTVVTPYRPRRIVFYAGDNDIDARKTPDQVFRDFETFMALKTAKLGETPVYVISVKPSKLRFAQLEAQAEVNAKLKALAAERADLVYVDVVTPMMDGPEPRDIFIADGLHMTPEGYAIWTRAIKPVLTAAPPTRAPGCPA